MKRQTKLLGSIGVVAALMASGLIMGFTGEMAGMPAGGAMKSPPLVLGPMIFVSNRAGIISGTPNGNDLWTMEANGGNPQRVFPTTRREWAEFEPQWDPSGTKIAFTSNEDAIRSGGNANFAGDWDVYVLDTIDGSVTNLTPDDPANPSYDFGSTWSNDGRIAFASDRHAPGSGDFKIYVMNADGSGTPVRLTNTAGSEGHPAWSRDGTKIAFKSNDDIHVIVLSTGAQTNLTNHAAADWSPNWSPDGSKIAFTSSRTGNTDVYSMNALNGSGLKRLTTSNAEDNEPAYSPDGTKIVFYRRHDVENHEIYIMNADGKQQTRLTNNYPYIDGDPTWKPLAP